MRRLVYSVASLVFFLTGVSAQTVQDKLQKAVQQFLNDPQMRYASIGFSVVNSQTGTHVYEYNGNTGLVPASCQKIATSAVAFELLGKSIVFIPDWRMMETLLMEDSTVTCI